MNALQWHQSRCLWHRKVMILKAEKGSLRCRNTFSMRFAGTLVVLSNIKVRRCPAHLGLCGSAVLISAAHEDGIVASRAAEASITVRTEHRAHNVAQMRHIIDVGQGTRDQDVTLVCTSMNGASAEGWLLPHRSVVRSRSARHTRATVISEPCWRSSSIVTFSACSHLE